MCHMLASHTGLGCSPVFGGSGPQPLRRDEPAVLGLGPAPAFAMPQPLHYAVWLCSMRLRKWSYLLFVCSVIRTSVPSSMR